jgi:enamine deaminase RidA (YjgF/YER057c/UK114 family)
MIARIPGGVPSRSRAAVYHGIVHAVATAPIKSGSVYDQMKQCLAFLDETLTLAGTGKRRVLTVTVYLADMTQKAEMNRAWEEWVDPFDAPVRACIGAQLQPGDLVELVVQAAE